MQLTFYGEDFREGLTSEWAAVPRIGEEVIMTGAGGETRYRVSDVVYHINNDGSLHSVIVDVEA